MKKVNGYSVAVRLCEYSTLAGTGLSFPLLCKVFGPVYWQILPALSKFYYKRVAIQYKQTAIGIAERAGTLPTRDAFLDAIFGERLDEREHVIQELTSVTAALINMTAHEMQIILDTV